LTPRTFAFFLVLGASTTPVVATAAATVTRASCNAPFNVGSVASDSALSSVLTAAIASRVAGLARARLRRSRTRMGLPLEPVDQVAATASRTRPASGRAYTAVLAIDL